MLREEITRPYVEGQPSSGSWGGNVLSWLDGAAPTAVLRYEDLIAAPRASVEGAVSSLLPCLTPVADARAFPPSASFTRSTQASSGAAGSHRDEMPAEMHELFWSRPENAAAMRRLGYAA